MYQTRLLRKERVVVRHGSHAVCTAYLRTNSGDSATAGQSGQVEIQDIVSDELVKEFGDYEVVARTGDRLFWMYDAEVDNPIQIQRGIGLDAIGWTFIIGILPDGATGASAETYLVPLKNNSWVPGIHGKYGYNVQVKIPAMNFQDRGVYRYRALILGLVQEWQIIITG